MGRKRKGSELGDRKVKRQKEWRDMTKEFRSRYEDLTPIEKVTSSRDMAEHIPSLAVKYTETNTVFDSYLMFKAHVELGHVPFDAEFWEDFEETKSGSFKKVKMRSYGFTSKQIDEARKIKSDVLWMRDAITLAIDQNAAGKFDILEIFQMTIGYRTLADVVRKYNHLFFTKGYTRIPVLFSPVLVRDFLDDLHTFFCHKESVDMDRYKECCDMYGKLLDVPSDKMLETMTSFNVKLHESAEKVVSPDLCNVVHTMNSAITQNSYDMLTQLVSQK